MSSMEELEQRLTAVEREVTALREQATDTHTLAAHADRDVAEFRTELRAQTRLISALRETQVGQGQELASQGERLTSLYEDVTALRTEMVARFDQVHGGLEQIVSMLGVLSGQADEP
jgi:chromosome segregation ATPase